MLVKKKKKKVEASFPLFFNFTQRSQRGKLSKEEIRMEIHFFFFARARFSLVNGGEQAVR